MVRVLGEFLHGVLPRVLHAVLRGREALLGGREQGPGAVEAVAGGGLRGRRVVDRRLSPRRREDGGASAEPAQRGTDVDAGDGS